MLVKLYKDDKGNLWYNEGLDEETQEYTVVLVEEDQGHYIYTHNNWFMSEDELKECEEIVVDTQNF